MKSVYSPFVCKYPFTYVSKDSAGYCKPCCRYDLDQEDYADKSLKGSVEEAFQSQTFKKIRRKMLKGEKIAGCQKCYDEEEGGAKSFGRKYTEKYSYFPSGTLKGLNIAFSNKCNLACRMCNPHFSTKWNSLWKKLYPDKHNLNRGNTFPEMKDIISQETTLKSVEQWDIVGGEPFIDDSFYKFLKKMEKYNLSNKSIDINTNGTFFPQQKYIDILLRFKDISLGLSVDGTGELGEYIRVYSKWDEIDKAADQWSQLRHKHNSFYLYSFTTVSAYNIHDLYSIFKWSSGKNMAFRFHLLYKPEYLQIEVLPKRLRERIYKYYLEFPDFKKHLLKLKKHLNEESSGNIKDFLDFTCKMDSILGQNFFQINKYYKKEDLSV